MRQVLITIVLLFVAEHLTSAHNYVPGVVPDEALNLSAPIFNSSWLYNNTKPLNNTHPIGEYLPSGNNTDENNNYKPPTGWFNHDHHPHLNFSKYFPYYNGTYSGNYGEDVFLGSIQYEDKLLFNEVFRKESRWWTSRGKIVNYNAGYQRISAVHIINHRLDGPTARAVILSGGVGYPYVRISLESQWNRGFQFLVKIYGH